MVAVAAGSEYRRLLIESRKTQLKLNTETVERMATVLKQASDRLAAELEGLPDDGAELRKRFIASRKNEIDRIIDLMREHTAGVITAGTLENAQAAVSRESAAYRLVKPDFYDVRLDPHQHRRITISDGAGGTPHHIRIGFSQVALDAMERLANRTFDGDKLKLSDRIWNASEAARIGIHNELLSSLATGASARATAQRLRHFLTEPGPGNTGFNNAMRLARTEINAAYREAHVLSARDRNGELRDFITGIQWCLSLSHKHKDICDLWAGEDMGLGPGVYLPEDVPSDHPHGLCFTVSVLKDYPELTMPQKKPAPEEVADGQVDYYARNGDTVAQRERSRRAGETVDPVYDA